MENTISSIDRTLAHTGPLDANPMAFRDGLLTCLWLCQNNNHHQAGLILPDTTNLNAVICNTLGETDGLSLINKKPVILHGITIIRLTELLDKSELLFPVLAACITPARCRYVVSTWGSTDVVFVPNRDCDLKSFLSDHPYSKPIVILPPIDENYFLDLSSVQKDRLKWFVEHSTCIRAVHVMSTGSDIYLGNKQNRVCRYCGRQQPDVTFHNTAHAIPDQIGNKTLFDWNECDTCNAHFSKMLEDDLGKWTLPWRTMMRTSGKQGIPTFKSRDKKLRVAGANKNNLHMSIHADDERFSTDEERRRFSLKLERQPYVPMGVFKCMVKMALAIMPDQEGVDVSHLKQWILESSHSHIESYPYRLIMFHQFVPGPVPSDRIDCLLFRRRPDRENCPFYVFVLIFGNMICQIVLPMPNEDQEIIANGTTEVGVFPNLLGTTSREDLYGVDTAQKTDMSSTERVPGDDVSTSFSYDSRLPSSLDDKEDGTSVCNES